MNRNIKALVNNIVLIAIFLLVLSNIGSYITSLIAPEAGVYRYSNYWYPLWNTIDMIIVSGILIWKVYRFKSCVFTQIVVWLYTLLSLFSLLYVIFPIPRLAFLNVVGIAILIALAFLLLCYLLIKYLKQSKWFYKLLKDFQTFDRG